MKTKTTLLPIVLAVFLFSCGSSKTKGPDTLFGPTWELEFLSGPRIAFEGLFPDKKPQISFEKGIGQAIGNSGCNGYRAPFEIDGKKIRFGEPGPSTLMYCGEGENHFRNIIQKVDRWRLTEEGKLELLLGEVPMMRFKALPWEGGPN